MIYVSPNGLSHVDCYPTIINHCIVIMVFFPSILVHRISESTDLNQSLLCVLLLSGAMRVTVGLSQHKPDAALWQFGHWFSSHLVCWYLKSAQLPKIT